MNNCRFLWRPGISLLLFLSILFCSCGGGGSPPPSPPNPVPSISSVSPSTVTLGPGSSFVDINCNREQLCFRIRRAVEWGKRTHNLRRQRSSECRNPNIGDHGFERGESARHCGNTVSRGWQLEQCVRPRPISFAINFFLESQRCCHRPLALHANCQWEQFCQRCSCIPK